MSNQEFSRQVIYNLQIPAQSEEDLKSQINLLRHLVIELLREVEVLRETQINESKQQGISPKHSIYGKTYRERCLSVHNSMISAGLEGLVNRWISDKTTRNGLAVQELLMLERLGYTPEEIEEYLEKVEEVSIYT